MRDTLVELGPVFAGFGRYLASRVDLLPRRTRLELHAIPDEGDALPIASVAALIHAELGAPLDRLFFEFQPDPLAVGAWTQRHFAWLSPGVPVTVTIVRPQLDEALALMRCRCRRWRHRSIWPTQPSQQRLTTTS